MPKRRAQDDSDCDVRGNNSAADSASEYEDTPHRTPTAKKRRVPRVRASKKRLIAKSPAVSDVVGPPRSPALFNQTHPKSRHTIASPNEQISALLKWYSKVHETRCMPWRKPYDPSLNPEERAQRAYEANEITLYPWNAASYDCRLSI